MNEEIKEILGRLEYDKDDIYYIGFADGINVDNTFLPKDIKILLNYITNLQKENQSLKNELKSKPDNEITLETKEGQIMTIIQSERIDMQEKLNKSLNNAIEKYQDYKQRNEKAVEYIKKDTRWFDSEYTKIYGMLCDCEGAKGDRLEVLVNPSNLLNILQGGDE